MIGWLLFLKTNDNFSEVDVIFKRGDSDQIYMRINETIDDKNLIQVEESIINLINLYVSIRETVYVVLDENNLTKYRLGTMMPKLSCRLDGMFYIDIMAPYTWPLVDKREI